MARVKPTPAKAKPPARTPAADADVRSLVTPEGVDLRLRLADVGQRLSALILDELLMAAIFIGGTIVAVIAGIFGLFATRSLAGA